jgi:hypothetical protein
MEKESGEVDTPLSGVQPITSNRGCGERKLSTAVASRFLQPERIPGVNHKLLFCHHLQMNRLFLASFRRVSIRYTHLLIS